MTPRPNARTQDLQVATAAPAPRMLTSAELFGGHDEIIVLHNGAPYRLRITRQNKLILTK